jgi:hypothetical protein
MEKEGMWKGRKKWTFKERNKNSKRKTIYESLCSM